MKKIIMRSFLFLFSFFLFTLGANALECEYKCKDGDATCEEIISYVKIVSEDGKLTLKKRNINGTKYIQPADPFDSSVSISGTCPSTLYAYMSKTEIENNPSQAYVYKIYASESAASTRPNKEKCYHLVESKVDVNKTYTCDYKCKDGDEKCNKLVNKFQLQIDQQNKTIEGLGESVSTNGTLTKHVFITIDESLPREWFNENNVNAKSCQDFYACMSGGSDSSYGGTEYYNFSFYADSASASKRANHDGCYTVTYASNKAVLKPEETNYKCKTLENKVSGIQNLYIEINSLKARGQSTGKQYQELSQEKQVLNKFCDGAFSSFNYNNDCVQECIDVDQKLAELKNKYENCKLDAEGNCIDDGSNNAKCGLSARLANWIMKFVNWMRYIVPVLLILLSVLDFIKAIAADSEDEIKKVTSKFVKRLIVAVIIFLVPLLLEFLLGIFGIPTNDFCL